MQDDDVKVSVAIYFEGLGRSDYLNRRGLQYMKEIGNNVEK